MLKVRPKSTIPIIAAVFAIAVGGGSATALAHEDSDYGWGGYYWGHVQREQRHIARERAHMNRERWARDEMLRHGNLFGALSMQQHLRRERHHVRREREHVGHELFHHDFDDD